MKNIILSLCFFSSVSVHASIDYDASKNVELSTQEIASSRACFQEAATLGCRHPSEDTEYFQSCIKDQKQLLSQKCRSKFDRLYGK